MTPSSDSNKCQSGTQGDVLSAMLIDRKKTNAYLRTKQSQNDVQDSSRYIGIVASCVLAIPFVLTALSDAINLFFEIIKKKP